jgi:hypothetical protein
MDALYFAFSIASSEICPLAFLIICHYQESDKQQHVEYEYEIKTDTECAPFPMTRMNIPNIPARESRLVFGI